MVQREDAGGALRLGGDPKGTKGRPTGGFETSSRSDERGGNDGINNLVREISGRANLFQINACWVEQGASGQSWIKFVYK